MAPTAIPEGYELLAGRSRENARAALDSAVDKGFEESVVLTHPEGYLIPLTEDEKAAAAVETAEAEEIELPTAKNSNAEIDAWRDEHLAGFEYPAEATNKDGKVAAITAEVERHTALQDAEDEAAEAEGRDRVLLAYEPVKGE